MQLPDSAILPELAVLPVPPDKDAQAVSVHPQTPLHLGGHRFKTHCDAGALLFLRDQLGAKSLLDIGCGVGGQIKLARQLGFEAEGVDGDPQVFDAELMRLHDFTTGPYISERAFDVAWSVECLQQIEDRFLSNYLSAFDLARIVVLSAAPPGTGGWHHVNCQRASYWIEVFGSAGFRYNSDLTTRLRAASTMKRDFIRGRGLVLVKQ